MAAKTRYLFGGMETRTVAPWLMLLPGLGFYFLIGVGPSLATFVYSFTDATGIRGLPISWVGFDNFDEFLFQGARSRDNLDALKRTLIFMVLVTTIQFSVGLLMALLVNQKLRGRLVFRTLFFVPVILGVAVQGLMWKLFLRPGGGPMDSIFGWFGLESQFLNGSNAFYWVIVVQIWANAGFTMVIFLAGMQTIPADLYEAAAVDGASRLEALQEHHLAAAHARHQHQLLAEHRRFAAGVDAVPRADRLQERHPGARVRRLRRGVRWDRQRVVPPGICRRCIDRAVRPRADTRNGRQRLRRTA